MRLLTFLSGCLLFIIADVKLPDKAPFLVQNPPVNAVFSLAWSPDGSKLAVGRGVEVCSPDYLNTYGIQILNPTNGQLITTLAGAKCPTRSLDWSPDGSKLVGTTSEEIGIRIWNVATGQIIVTGQQITYGYLAAKWNPAGTRIATTDVGGGVYIVNASNGQILNVLILSGSQLDWSPDGTKLVTGSGSQYENKISVFNTTTNTSVLESQGGRGSVDWSPDGTKLVSSSLDNTVRIWNANSGASLFTLSGHTDYIVQVAWNPDSRRIASASNDGTVRIWDSVSGQLQKVIQVNNRVSSVAWSPDGTKLAYGDLTGTVQIIDANAGLLGQYYDNSDLTNHKLDRVDSVVDFNWGTGSPDALISVDTFSVRWTGQVIPQYSQTYTFYTQSDDGVRLWVNNQQIINNWTNHNSTENSGTIALTAGVRYTIRMEYYENINSSIARLSWSSSSQPKQVIPTNRLLPNGRIAFQTFRDGNDEIYLMNGDGTNQVNFSSNSAADQFPAIAVGTQNLLFASTRTGNAEIFTAPLGGGAATNLTNHGSYDHYVAQAPDGRIVFASTRSAGGNFDLWTMNANGTGLTQLTNTSGSAERNSNWSPDGQWIVYDAEVSGVYDLWKVPAAGGTAVRLTQNVGSNSDPSWSPDGTTIVFKTTRDTGHAIYLMNENGTNQRPFKTGGLNGFNPTWSPDGTYITYQAYPSSQPDIYSISLGGTTSTQLTNNAAADQAASWGAQ